MSYYNDRPTETGVLLEHNPQGYRVNINHPAVRPLYERYMRWRNIPPWCPLSDGERKDFEKYILTKLEEQTNDTIRIARSVGRKN